MSEKIAYFILGSEGSGTHMLRNALIEAGCNWQQGHESYQINYKFDEIESPLVFRRSLPHAGRWPNIRNIVYAMENTGFKIHILFTIRDFNASAKSTIQRGYQGTIDDCYFRQRNAIVSIGEFLVHHHAEFTYVTYEGFCLSEGFRKWLFNDRLELPYPKNFEIKYANPKYYNDEKDLK